jgi:hypothetical protein
MSRYKACTCEGKRRWRMKNWRVIQHKTNRAGQEIQDDRTYAVKKATMVCLKCKNCFRTKSRKYVYDLRDLSTNEEKELNEEGIRCRK